MIPDEFLAQNIQNETGIRMITWPGHCEVHERFTPVKSVNIAACIRRDGSGPPECPPDVVAEADYAGSTAGMIDYVGRSGAGKVLLVTECSMSDNLAVMHPEVEFVRPCNLCPHMKRITLTSIREVS